MSEVVVGYHAQDHENEQSEENTLHDAVCLSALRLFSPFTFGFVPVWLVFVFIVAHKSL